MPYETSELEFQQLVAQAIRRLPERWRQTLEENVPVTVVDRPSPELLRDMEIPEEELLLGLFEGVAMPDMAAEGLVDVPPRIWIFRHDVEDFSEDRDDLIEQVRITLLHELGHYFGLDEDDLADLGYA
ncbi:MAG: metallopeptidase family protein [Planctomycetota bacterium]